MHIKTILIALMILASTATAQTFLEQSTAVDVLIGPFVDDTDGKTAETALTIAQADVRLSKNAGNMAQKNESTAATHDELGYYTCPLDATDTGTLGRLKVMIHESGALPVWHEFMVVPSNTWDSLVGGSDYLQTDATQIEGADATDTINAQADTAIADAALATAAALVTIDDFLDTEIAAILADTAELQTDWANGGRLDLLLDGVLEDTGTTLPAMLTTIDDFLDTEIALILADTAELQADWVNGGRLDLLLDAVLADTGTTLPATLVTIDNFLDTEITAILADSAELQANQGAWATATSVTVSDKTGFKLAADGLDTVAITAPAGVASDFREMQVQLWRRFFQKATMTATEIKSYADDGTTVLTTQTISDDGTTQTQGAGS